MSNNEQKSVTLNVKGYSLDRNGDYVILTDKTDVNLPKEGRPQDRSGFVVGNAQMKRFAALLGMNSTAELVRALRLPGQHKIVVLATWRELGGEWVNQSTGEVGKYTGGASGTSKWGTQITDIILSDTANMIITNATYGAGVVINNNAGVVVTPAVAAQPEVVNATEDDAADEAFANPTKRAKASATQPA